MRKTPPALLAIFSVLLLCPLLEAAPRGGVAKAGPEEESAQSSSTQSAAMSAPVVSRRIVTKVDGVIVEERDDSGVQAPMLMPQSPAAPEANGDEQPAPRIPDG
ncbi:MAG: hypothetical protein ACQKBW_08150, partial [Puniceicoccales bacterium]